LIIFVVIILKPKEMALIKSVRGFDPQIGDDCYLAENATVVGDVVMGKGCSVWFNAVLRGDVNSIRIGNHVNIQDGSVLHTLYEKSTVEIGDYVSIGHNVTIHGAKIDNYALIGMGATLLDYAEVGEGAIIAAGSLVLSNTKIPPYTLWAGVPAKYVKDVEPEQTNDMNRKIAHNYAMYAGWFKE
jgi:carbonic anhydrase/acetyltransferase-like protein (isoleucine patch superfamily)